MALQLIVSTAGRAAIAALGGSDAVLITEVGVTASHVVVTEATAVLTGEIKRIDTVAGVAVAADQIHLTVRDISADVYSLRSFALYLDDGTLFAAYGQAGVIMEKTAPVVMYLSLDIALEDISADDVTFGDTDFVLPPATETVQGVVELATNGEMTTGTDTARAATPAGVRAAIDDRVPQATTTTQGKVELATDAEAIAGTDTDRAVTPSALAAALEILTTALAENPHSTQLGEGRAFHRQVPESDYYKFPNGQSLSLPEYQDLADALDGDAFVAADAGVKATHPGLWLITEDEIFMPDMRGQFARIWHDDLADAITRPALGRRKANQNKAHTHATDPHAGTNTGSYGAEPFEGGPNPGGNQTGSSGGDEAVPDHTAIWYLIRVL